MQKRTQSQNQAQRRLRRAYELLKEAEEMLPVKEGTAEGMQASEKIWGAWAQATKAFKYWRTERGYNSVIGELYEKFPEFKEEIRVAHRCARAIHSDGFYEGITSPLPEDLKTIKKGIEIIERVTEGKGGRESRKEVM